MTIKKIKTSDILGDNYYIYELTSSNYTPALNDTVTITCTMKDVYGAAAGSKSITLYQNGTSVSVKTTNSSGVATWSVTCSNAGIQSFKVGNKTIEVFVDNKEDKSNKVTSISSSSTDTQYPSAKAVYDILPTFNITILTTSFFQDPNTYNTYFDEGGRQNSGSPSITYDDGELIFTSGDIYGSLNYYYSNIFSQTNYYTISFKIKKPSGSYVGKDFCIMIGDKENAMRFFFGFYNIDCRMLNENEAQSQSGQIVNASEYTDVSITRNGNMWTLDYNNGEYVSTVTSYNNTIVNKLIVNDINWSKSGTIYIKDMVIEPKQRCIADFIYPIGSIYMSVNSTSPQILFGGTWEQLKDRFLLGSGDTYANASTGGEATHTLTTNEMPSHTHTQNSHNHTQNSHNHTQNSHNHALTGSKSVGLQEGSKLRVGYGSTSDSKNTNNTTATNKATTATNQSATATNQNTGGGQAHNNMPPYLVVYMWKRIA